MRSKLNRLMAKKQPSRGPQMPSKQNRTLRIVDNTKPLQRAPESSKWLIALVEPRCEDKSANSLREAGHLVWYPQMTLWQTNASMRIKAKVNRPLFPRYLFVSKGENASKSIKDCDYVTKLIGDIVTGKIVDGDDRSKRLMRQLSDRQVYGEFDTTKPLPLLERADQVIVASGPFEDLIGIVTKTDMERTSIMLRLFNSEREIVVETASLRKVA